MTYKNTCSILLFCGCFSAFSVFAQHDISRQVFASAGHSVERQGISYDYTIGQSIVSTLSNDTYTLTQGFQQPDKKISVSIFNPKDASTIQIELFPNPVSYQMNIKIPNAIGSLRISIVDALGQTTGSLVKMDGLVSGQTLDCSYLAAGSYFLIFQSESGQRLGVAPFIKL